MIPYSLHTLVFAYSHTDTISTMWTRQLCDFWLRKLHYCRCSICTHVANDVVDVPNIQHFFYNKVNKRNKTEDSFLLLKNMVAITLDVARTFFHFHASRTPYFILPIPFQLHNHDNLITISTFVYFHWFFMSFFSRYFHAFVWLVRNWLLACDMLLWYFINVCMCGYEGHCEK